MLSKKVKGDTNCTLQKTEFHKHFDENKPFSILFVTLIFKTAKNHTFYTKVISNGMKTKTQNHKLRTYTRFQIEVTLAYVADVI